MTCSTLVPARAVDDASTNDCGYRNGNAWWLDHVAGSLTWSPRETARTPVIVAVFDDGVATDHPDLRNQLWTNEREARGARGVDDDGNGYVDDIHGWNFVENDPAVAGSPACAERPSHGTFMASLIAAERNNGTGIAAAGADGARIMPIRIFGCGRGGKDVVDPVDLARAVRYAAQMGARILSFSADWDNTTPELDAAFRDVAHRGSKHAAIVVAAVSARGKLNTGYPAAYPFRRIVRAVPIGDDNTISPGTSAAPPGLNLAAPSACVLGATNSPQRYALAHGSSNSTAIIAGLLAGIWSSPSYDAYGVDRFVAEVVRDRMLRTPRRTKPDLRAVYPQGVPVADACVLATAERSAQVCREP